MLKAYRFCIYPSKKQRILITKTFGCCRFVYNCFLDRKIRFYETEHKTLSYGSCSKGLTGLKLEKPWLNEVDSTALQQSLRDLDSAYGNFFSGSGFPKFKSRHSNRHSYRTQMVKGNIKVKGNSIRLPKLGWVKFARSRDVEGRIQNVTVSRTPAGRYFISVCCEVEIKKFPKVTNRIGVDMGIKNFCYISNKPPVENPKYLRALEKQLAKAQRQLASKEKGSGNYRKARLKVARIHERIANQRRDFLHKLSTRLISENQVVYLEDLRISKMVQDSRLAKSILDCSWSEFFRMLQYKAEWYGRDVFYLDRFFPSSQECNVCHCKNPDVKDLRVRTWTCPDCGAIHDRDGNASLNILKEGCRLYPAI